MNPKDIAERIQQALPDAQIELAGADCSFELLVVSESLRDQSQLARQRSLLALFSHELASGVLHALTIRAKTPAELKASRALVILQ